MSEEVRSLGIDPGIHGAWVLLRNGRWDLEMPMQWELKSSGKKRLDTFALLRGMFKLLDHCGPDARIDVALELVASRPGQGAGATFSFGESFGATRYFASEIALRTNGSLHLIAPQVWKKAMGLNQDKAHSIAVAQRQFPQNAETIAEQNREERSGMAEAALLARYLYETGMGTLAQKIATKRSR